jgi:hypothetical protein
LEITQDIEFNMINGGLCSIFDLISAVNKSLANNLEVRDSILTTLKPEILLKKGENKQ